MPTTDPTSARRIELILQQVESLPTLPSVAMRLLHLTSDEGSRAQEVIDTVKDDPSLTAKVLSLCKGASTGVKQQTLTIDKAVMLLGFETIRNAVLSIKVFETFDEDEPSDDGAIRFSRAAFWRHCLAVGIAAESIAMRHADLDDIDPSEAFVCGLLHGIGKLALEHVLPKSYQRVVELTEQTQSNIAETERKVLGIDHHTAGKRLCEKWNLPHLLSDTVWLYECPYRSLPDVPHKRMVALVGLAELVARKQHIGYSGNYALTEDTAKRAETAGLSPAHVESAARRLIEQVEQRTEALGLAAPTSRKLFLESIMQANGVLGRLNAQLETHRRRSVRQAKAIEAITRFHADAASSARSIADVLTAVSASAASVLGGERYAIVYQPSGEHDWQFSQHNAEGRITATQLVDPPPAVSDLAELSRREELPVEWMGVLPWLSDYLVGFADLRKVRLMPLPCAWGTAAVLVHDRPTHLPDDQLEALTHTWGAAIGAATQHEGARRLSEQLAEANRIVTETQETLLRTESLARLGEMAAGAAHEMNNPLAIISGRGQLLSMQLEAGTKEQQAAALIFEQSQKLSDMITAMHLFADPPKPTLEGVAIDDVMRAATRLVKQKMPQAPAVVFDPSPLLRPLRTDKHHLAAAMAELLLNAHEAGGRDPVQVRAQVDPLDNRLILKVTDTGNGMDAHTLEHAFDPFFSSKPAGRQPGLGLARAQRLVETLNGRIELTSTPDEGTTATILLPLAGSASQTDEPTDEPIESDAAEVETTGGTRAVDSHT